MWAIQMNPTLFQRQIVVTRQQRPLFSFTWMQQQASPPVCTCQNFSLGFRADADRFVFVENLQMAGMMVSLGLHTVTLAGPGVVLGNLPSHPVALGTVLHSNRLPDFPSVNRSPALGWLAIVCVRIYGLVKGSGTGLGGVAGLRVATTGIILYFLLLSSPYLSVQRGLLWPAQETFMMPNTFSVTSFVCFLLCLCV